MASPPRVKNPAAAARYGTLASAILALADGTRSAYEIAQRVNTSNDYVNSVIRKTNRDLGFPHYATKGHRYTPHPSLLPVIITPEISAKLQRITPEGATIADTALAIIIDAINEEFPNG